MSYKDTPTTKPFQVMGIRRIYKYYEFILYINGYKEVVGPIQARQDIALAWSSRLWAFQNQTLPNPRALGKENKALVCAGFRGARVRLLTSPNGRTDKPI